MSAPRLLEPAEPGIDRLERRRRATLEEILELSLEVMAEEGVGGLSLAEVARRMGMKPPSLYKHVDSKHAVYDALFAAGARSLDSELEATVADLEPSLEALALAFEASVRWAVDHPILSQLLFWRPVPGFEPTPASYAIAQTTLARLREALRAAVERGELRPEADSDAGAALYTSLATGVSTQQLANEPGVSFQEGRFTRYTREAFEMFVAHYAA